jgi:hypothetical protein
MAFAERAKAKRENREESKWQEIRLPQPSRDCLAEKGERSLELIS